MTDAGKRMYGPAQPATGGTTLFTVPGSHSYHVTSITIANTTAIPATITISIGADAAATSLMRAVPVAGNETIVLNGYWFLAAGDDMRASQGTSAAITVTVSGVDET